MTFPVKVNDLEPPYAAKLMAGGKPIDLTDCTVTFVMSLQSAPRQEKVRRAAVIDDAPNGLVHYAWEVGDTDTSDTYIVEWEITYPGNRQRTVPSGGYDTIVVFDRL